MEPQFKVPELRCHCSSFPHEHQKKKQKISAVIFQKGLGGKTFSVIMKAHLSCFNLNLTRNTEEVKACSPISTDVVQDLLKLEPAPPCLAPHRPSLVDVSHVSPVVLHL